MAYEQNRFNFSDYAKEENGKIVVSIPREMTHLTSGYKLEILRQIEPMHFLCSDISLTSESVKLSYDIESDFECLFNLSGKTELEKILILINIGRHFQHINKLYCTTFNPQNIYYSDSYEIRFAYRAISRVLPPQKYTYIEELEEYKALILSVLQNKYSFEALMDIGLDVLDKSEFFYSIMDAQTAEDIIHLLKERYNERYKEISSNKIAFKRRTIQLVSLIALAVFFLTIASTTYFGYRNIVQTDQYRVRMQIYESFYQRDSDKVVEYAANLSDEEMNDSLKLVVADALIAKGDKDSLVRAFNLDPSRHIEIILKLIDLNETDVVANLRSDELKVQLYQAYYAKDYNRVIDLATTEMQLKYDAQAQTLLAKAYMNINDFISAEAVVESLGDLPLRKEIYQTHREFVMANEVNIDLRKQIIDRIDSLLKDIEEEEANRPKNEQPTTSPSQSSSQPTSALSNSNTNALNPF